jgi:GrpB-like predicted nucleotidyltransferase (UPF0157 family)
MIGSPRNTVSLRLYNPNWKHLFEQEKNEILETVGQYVIDIQHIGSTSIEGLDAKPIIDIALAVGSFDEIDKIASALKPLGYARLKVKIEGKTVFAKDTEMGRTHSLHLELHKCVHWVEHIAFRDYLRSNPKAVDSYKQLKHSLALRYSDDVKSYTEGKKEFVDDILMKAKQAGY